jgi:hypothetical protein
MEVYNVKHETFNERHAAPTTTTTVGHSRVMLPPHFLPHHGDSLLRMQKVRCANRAIR